MTDQYKLSIASEADMRQLGLKLGGLVRGGEVIELSGDVGAGKTTLTKAIALGMNITEPIQSPTFTISRLYETPHDLRLAHYDFYRLHEAGIMSDELVETLSEPTTVTVVEWAGLVDGVLPADRLRIDIVASSEFERSLTLKAGGAGSARLLQGVKA